MKTKYQQIFEQIDRCENLEELRAWREGQTALALQKEFWQLRARALEEREPLALEKLRAKLRWLQQELGCSIPLRRAIHPFRAPQGLFGIIISRYAAVGPNCTLMPNVYIGSDTFPDSDSAGYPVLGSDVFMDTGSSVVGGVVIGDHVRIGAGCSVRQDIPANSIVTAGAPCVVQSSETPLKTTYQRPERLQEWAVNGVVYDCAKHPEDVLAIAQASPEELDEIYALYAERTRWFRIRRMKQWANYTLHHPREEFLETIRRGEYYTVKLDSRIIGGFQLTGDSGVWADDSADALYLRRVVARVGFRGVGGRVTEAAKQMTRDAGKQFLRVEAVHSNPKLNEIWERRGLRFVRIVRDDVTWELREWKAE